MAPRRRPPLFLLTGFLGSGKTSLLRRWLAEPAFANTLVLVNEIGEIGIDQQMLAPLAGDALLLENGCVCCDAGGDLVAMLEQLFFDRLHRRISSFDRVVIETTGLALPSMALQLLAESEVVRERYADPFVIATFDAVDGVKKRERHPEVRDQIACAQVIVLTKTDVATDVQISAAHELLSKLRSDIPVLRSGAGPVEASAILDLAARAPVGHRGAGPDASLVEHTPGVTTAFAPLPQDVHASALEAALLALLSSTGGKLLRVKGHVRITGAGPHLVQADSSGVRLEPIAAIPDVFGLTIIAAETSAADLAASLAMKLMVRGLRI
ncbi:MAG: GTP-binding protein [Hyphomicrobiales bacterium]|nr:GTP-binding protein [Hyphomicrobiales bacterium]